MTCYRKIIKPGKVRSACLHCGDLSAGSRRSAGSRTSPILQHFDRDHSRSWGRHEECENTESELEQKGTPSPLSLSSSTEVRMPQQLPPQTMSLLYLITLRLRARREKSGGSPDFTSLFVCLFAIKLRFFSERQIFLLKFASILNRLYFLKHLLDTIYIYRTIDVYKLCTLSL